MLTAAEDLCQKLEEYGDTESVKKARAIRNEVFAHLKRGYKMTLISNFDKHIRRKQLWLKIGYVPFKTEDQIHE